MPTVLSSFRGFRPSFLRGDVIAGLTVWAVLVPESLAYATIAGVSPVVGLYAAVPSLVLYAIFGSSKQLVVASMSGTAALSAAVVADFAKQGTDAFVATTAAVAIVTGVLGLIAGLCKLGFLSSFISEPVLKGFIIGLALTIIIGQVPALIGVEKPSGSFFEKLWGILGELGDIHGLTLLVGGLGLVAILVLKEVAPKVPASLVVVLLGILAVSLFNLDDHGLDIVGTIPSGLPSIAVPDLSLHQYLDLVGPCIGVLLIALAEGLGAAKSYAAKEGYDIDTNAELVGLGAANIGAGLASGMVVNGSLSKTAVNGGAGAKSQFSTITVSVLVVLTLLFLTGLFENLPEAVLAAVVIAAVIELVDFGALRRLWGVWSSSLGRIYSAAARADFIAATGALVGVLIFDTLPGLFIGITLSLIALLYRSSRPNVATLGRLETDTEEEVWVDLDRNPDAAAPGAALVLRVEAGLYFANADHVRDVVRARITDTTRVVVLDAETMPSIDVSGAAMLATLKQDLARDGIDLALAKSIGQFRDVVTRAETPVELPATYATIDDAVASVD